MAHTVGNLNLAATNSSDEIKSVSMSSSSFNLFLYCFYFPPLHSCCLAKSLCHHSCHISDQHSFSSTLRDKTGTTNCELFVKNVMGLGLKSNFILLCFVICEQDTLSLSALLTLEAQVSILLSLNKGSKETNIEASSVCRQ